MSTRPRTYPEYPNIAAFYAERGGRSSPERDYGVHNTDGYSKMQRYRVSVVADTGDVYAEQQYLPQKVLLLGSFPGADDPKTRTLETYPPVYARADAAFADYLEGPLPGQTLAWFADRAPAPRPLTIS